MNGGPFAVQKRSCVRLGFHAPNTNGVIGVVAYILITAGGEEKAPGNFSRANHRILLHTFYVEFSRESSELFSLTTFGIVYDHYS